MISSERASQEEQNDANFSSIALSSEELWVLKEIVSEGSFRWKGAPTLCTPS